MEWAISELKFSSGSSASHGCGTLVRWCDTVRAEHILQVCQSHRHTKILYLGTALLIKNQNSPSSIIIDAFPTLLVRKLPHFSPKPECPATLWHSAHFHSAFFQGNTFTLWLWKSLYFLSTRLEMYFIFSLFCLFGAKCGGINHLGMTIWVSCGRLPDFITNKVKSPLRVGQDAI